MVHFFALSYVLSTALALDIRARLRPVTVAHKFGAALGCGFAARSAIGLSFVRSVLQVLFRSLKVLSLLREGVKIEL